MIPVGEWTAMTFGTEPFSWRNIPSELEYRKRQERQRHGSKHGLRGFRAAAVGPLVVVYKGSGELEDLADLAELLGWRSAANSDLVTAVEAGLDLVATLGDLPGLVMLGDTQVSYRHITVKGTATAQFNGTAFGPPRERWVVSHLLAYTLGLDRVPIDREALRG